MLSALMGESTKATMLSSAPGPSVEKLPWWQGASLPAAATTVLALFHLAFVVASPLLEFLAVDLAAYDAWAKRIAAGDWLGTEIFYQDPLYPYLLGFLYRWLSPSLLWIFLLQIVAAAINVYLVHRIALWLFSPRTAIIAAWMLALYGPAVYYAVKPEKASLAAFGLTLAAYLILRACRLRSPGSGAGFLAVWMAAGFVCGMTSLLRGNVLLVGMALGFLVLATKLSARPIRGRMAPTLAVFLGLAMALLPVALRNRIVGGEWVLTTSQAGANLFIGNHPGNRTGSYDPPGYIRPSPVFEREDFRRHAEAERGRPLTPSEVSSFYLHEVLSWAREDPAAFLLLQAKKAGVFMQAWEIPDNWSFYFVRGYSPILMLAFVSWSIVAPLALLGLLMALLSKRRMAIALALLTLVYAGSVIGFYVFSRYRFPLVPLVCVFAAHGLVGFVGLTQARKWGSILSGGLVIALGVAAAQSTPLIDERVDLAHRHVNLASSFYLDGQFDRAEELLAGAKDLDSRSHGLWLLWSRIAADRGDYDREAVLLQRARELAPDHPEVLAQSLKHLVRTAGLKNATAFATSELARQESYLLRRTLAEATLAGGDLEGFGRQLDRLLSLYPDDAWVLEQMFDAAVQREDWAKAADLASRLHTRTGQLIWLEQEADATSRLVDPEI